MSERASAFHSLVHVSRTCLNHACGLPAQVDIKQHWSGIGFTLLGHEFVAPMGSFTETLEVPHFTKLPGVAPWVCGVSNVRGRLLPIYDMALFFGQQSSVPRHKRRVLIFEDGELFTGLMVDEVFGMRHFPTDTFSNDIVPALDAIKPFVSGCYQHLDRNWHVWQADLLTADERFCSAAA